jgi:hypothetical protein
MPLKGSAVASEREPCRVSVRSDVLRRTRFPPGWPAPAGTSIGLPVYEDAGWYW